MSRLPTRVQSGLHGAVGGLPRSFWALWAGALVNRVGTFVVPFLALYLTQRRHLAVSAAGFVVSL